MAPRSGEKSYKNYQSTIKSGVEFNLIAEHLDEEGRSKLLKEEIIYAWGNREGTSSSWNRMEYGDKVIFYAKKRLVMVGDVFYKKHSRELALAL